MAVSAGPSPAAAELTSNAAIFSPAATVRHVEVDGLRVILDIKSGNYNTLDQIASALWAVLTGQSTSSEAFEKISREYNVDQTLWNSELSSFAAKCEQQGLLIRGSSMNPSSAAPVSDRRPVKPSMWRAWLCLLKTHLALSRHGFEKIYTDCTRISTTPAIQSLGAAVHAFRRAENFFVLRRAPDDCLVRSLALFRFLRSAGFAPKHVIAVSRYPFRAHAWVESHGVPLLDDSTHGFTPIAYL